MLTLTFDSKVMLGIQKLSYHLHTSGKHCIKFEYHPSKCKRKNCFLCIFDLDHSVHCDKYKNPWSKTERGFF